MKIKTINPANFHVKSLTINCVVLCSNKVVKSEVFQMQNSYLSPSKAVIMIKHVPK